MLHRADAAARRIGETGAQPRVHDIVVTGLDQRGGALQVDAQEIDSGAGPGRTDRQTRGRPAMDADALQQHRSFQAPPHLQPSLLGAG